MKTRDELAEAILLASVATDPATERTRMMSPDAAYRQADAFVAERERWAGGTAAGWDGATIRFTRGQLDVIALSLGYDGRALPIDALVKEIGERAVVVPTDSAPVGRGTP